MKKGEKSNRIPGSWLSLGEIVNGYFLKTPTTLAYRIKRIRRFLNFNL